MGQPNSIRCQPTASNAYQDIAKAIWENRDQLSYAWRILRDGCCDGCGLGTNGLRDWTMKGVHLCNIRLQLLRFNTAPEMDYRLPEDVVALKDLSEKRPRELGRLPVPMDTSARWSSRWNVSQQGNSILLPVAAGNSTALC